MAIHKISDSVVRSESWSSKEWMGEVGLGGSIYVLLWSRQTAAEAR